MKKCLSYIFGIVFIMLFLVSCKKTVTIGTKTIDISKNYTIFISQSNEKGTLDQMRKGFVKGMVDKGFVEGTNVTYIYENAKGDTRIADKIADLAIEKKPDLIVGIGAISTLPLKDKIKDIPIVFLGCSNAEKIGLCDAKSMPVTNITGVRDSHLLKESLDFISQNYENVRKLGIIFDSTNPLASYDIDYLKFYATGVDIDIFTVSIKKESDIDKAIENIMPKIDAMFFACDDMVNKNAGKIITRCNNDKKLIFAVKGEVEGENLVFTYEPDKSLVGFEGADIVNSILKENVNIKEIKIRDVNF